MKTLEAPHSSSSTTALGTSRLSSSQYKQHQHLRSEHWVFLDETGGSSTTGDKQRGFVRYGC